MIQKIVFGGGCFWCIEAVFQRVIGVTKVLSGYTSGKEENPTYQQVCSGNSGHAEVVQIEYDTKQICLEDLLDIFFQAHDPTTLNKQGNDIGTQYRSLIAYTSEDQKKVIDKYIKNISNKYSSPIVTEITKLEKFYPAEEYHQNYYENNKGVNPYCNIVISPKIEKIEKKFLNKHFL